VTCSPTPNRCAFAGQQEVSSMDDSLNEENDRPTDAATSRQWRSVWRIHFYSGIFALPFIVLMALSGLVILYTQPIERFTQGELRTVDSSGPVISLDQQVRTVEQAFPGTKVTSVTPPSTPQNSTVVAIDDGSKSGRSVFIDPYTGVVLGSIDSGGGIIGLANRMHGQLNNDSLTIGLPAVSALWDSGPVVRDYVVGDLVLELLGVWTLVLVASGLVMWWPRSRRDRATTRSVLGVRRGVRRRARWRDLHGLSGIVLLSAMVITVMSGLAWSTYWGSNFTALANSLSPNVATDAPPSALGTRGDLDRLGNKINWNTGDRPIPESLKVDGPVPAPMSLDDIATIARSEGMKPGFIINVPANVMADTGEAIYGSFTVSNSWPRKTGEARDLFVDQFTGATLAEQTVYGNGAISTAMDTLVSTHMGTQLGIASRIMMTALCVLALWSVISAIVMYSKRRRPGTLGLPRRPVDVHLARNLMIVAVALAVVFPQWGVSALIVLGLDRFVIRRVRPLRVAFGQR
jgi:uncharacterized iron-regulated membrane protein